jgi:hypothetical protein
MRGEPLFPSESKKKVEMKARKHRKMENRIEYGVHWVW